MSLKWRRWRRDLHVPQTSHANSDRLTAAQASGKSHILWSHQPSHAAVSFSVVGGPIRLNSGSSRLSLSQIRSEQDFPLLEYGLGLLGIGIFTLVRWRTISGADGGAFWTPWRTISTAGRRVGADKFGDSRLFPHDSVVVPYFPLSPRICKSAFADNNIAVSTPRKDSSQVTTS